METVMEVLPGTSSDTVQEQSEIPVYNSDGSDSENPETQPKKRRGANKNWLFVSKFPNAEKAEDVLRAENTWSISLTHMTEAGKKRFYRCNKVKRSGPQCAAQVYLLFEASSDAVLLYRVDSSHNHDSIDNRSDYGISNEVKSEINKLFDLHMKPKAILNSLRRVEGIKVPTIKQLNNYLSDRRRIKYGSSTISLGELERWILDHSNIPENIHEVFVISYYIFEGEPPTFRFVLSTKHLLQLAAYSAKNIHADATYKLIWQGFPVLIVGTTDKERKFHPICLGVCSSERQDDFQILFTGLKESVFSIYSHSLQPSVLVCDAAKSIQNAFRQVFGAEPIIVRMCWAHAKKNMQTKVEQIISDKKAQKSILQDIDALQSVTSSEAFGVASQLFLRKWENQTSFIKYFKEEWLTQNCNWYLGAAPGSPATNNALESFNRSIKDSNTLRERFPLSRFLVVASEMVNEWSQKNTREPFSNVPPIHLNDWTKAYHWAKLDKNIKVVQTNTENNTYLVPGGEAKDVQCGNQWETFDEFTKIFFSTWKVVMPKEKNEWMKGICNCPQFFRKYMCKHILGLAIRLKYAAPPLEAKNIPIGQKRKRGRPSKAKRALIIQ